MSNDEKVPDDWLTTLDQPPVNRWLENENYPMGDDKTKEDILNYLKQKKDTALQTIVVEADDDLPQSFAHWWCYTRDARREMMAMGEDPDTASPQYSILNKWLDVVEDWKDDDNIVTHADIFGTFKAWLDILFVDMTVYDDEEQRDGVPRRSDDTIVWSGDDMAVKSRKETMKYIICQGLSIMEERGWSDGYNYWESECKKYLVFT